MEDSREEEVGSGEVDEAKREELRAITRSTGGAPCIARFLLALCDCELIDWLID